MCGIIIYTKQRFIPDVFVILPLPHPLKGMGSFILCEEHSSQHLSCFMGQSPAKTHYTPYPVREEPTTAQVSAFCPRSVYRVCKR
jgi:hypothetical protein